MIDRWESLLRTMTVEGNQDCYCTAHDLDVFEARTTVKLPFGFRQYCQVFGIGELSHSVRIWSPMSVESKFDLRLRGPDDLANLRDSVQHNFTMVARGAMGIDEAKLKRVHQLLQAAFPFGDTC